MAMSAAYGEIEMEKGMLDELLLISENIGVREAESASADDAARAAFVRGEDALQWAQDLQRALRRDDPDTRAVRRQFGRLRVFEQKLLPLFISSRDDVPLVSLHLGGGGDAVS